MGVFLSVQEQFIAILLLGVILGILLSKFADVVCHILNHTAFY